MYCFVSESFKVILNSDHYQTDRTNFLSPTPNFKHKETNFKLFIFLELNTIGTAHWQWSEYCSNFLIAISLFSTSLSISWISLHCGESWLDCFGVKFLFFCFKSCYFLEFQMNYFFGLQIVAKDYPRGPRF